SPSHHGRKLPDGADEVTLPRVIQQTQLDVTGVVGELDTEIGGVTQQRGQPGMGVVHVVDRVLVAVFGQQVEVHVDVGVDRVAGQFVAGRVDTDRVDQVVHRHHGARTLAHPHRLAARDQVDQLADHHLDDLGV